MQKQALSFFLSTDFGLDRGRKGIWTWWTPCLPGNVGTLMGIVDLPISPVWEPNPGQMWLMNMMDVRVRVM